MSEPKSNGYPVIGVRFSPALKRVVDRYLEIDAHLTYSDLIRDAVREKIKGEAPKIYAQMFEGAAEEGGEEVAET